MNANPELKNISVGEARTEMFRRAGLPADGGYNDQWVTAKMGPVPIAIPNSDARRRAVKLHDLHHLLTGFQTDWAGEGEISAWELASNCRGFVAAWILNLWAMFVGLVYVPQRTYRAFIWGLYSHNLYTGDFQEAYLAERLGDMRRRLNVDLKPATATLMDKLTFAAFASLSVGIAVLMLSVAAAPIVWLVMK